MGRRGWHKSNHYRNRLKEERAKRDEANREALKKFLQENPDRAKVILDIVKYLKREEREEDKDDIACLLYPY